MFAHQHRFSVLPLSNDSLRPQDHNRHGRFSANYFANSRTLLNSLSLFLQLNFMGLPSTCTYQTPLFLLRSFFTAFLSSVFPLLTIILGTHSASSLFSFFIIVSLAPSVFLAYRITDSETSQTRQPSTVCLLFSFSVHCAILMPFYKDQSCALQQQWPPCLCFQPRATSLASKTLTIFHAQRLLVRLVFLPLSGGETGSDTLLTLLRFLQSFAFRIYRSSKTLNIVDTSNFSRDRTGGTALSSPFHAYFIFYPYQRRYVFC